jgi:ZIP family zinc transporter
MTSFNMGGECTEGHPGDVYDATVLTAAWWAGLAASTLVLGAVLGIVIRASPRFVGLVMGFGAGALIASVSFELTEEAFAIAGGRPVAAGLALGALTFFVGDTVLDRMGAAHRKRLDAPADEDGAALALLLGAALDGIPESLIIGLSLLAGGGIELAFLVSVAVSNVPEAFASASSRHKAGVPMGRILLQWAAIVAVSAAFGAIGFVAFDQHSPWAVAFTQSFGAGALLTMVMDTMAPEAYRDAGPTTGLVSVAGFAFAFYLGTL